MLIPAEQPTANELGTEPLTVHTDGGAAPNPGLGGWAVVFSRDCNILTELSGTEDDTTNQVMELVAIRAALQHAPSAAPLHIFTDSAAAIGWLDKGWKRNAPHLASISHEIDALRAARGGKVTFTHVRGHGSNALNNRADALVNQARAARLS